MPEVMEDSMAISVSVPTFSRRLPNPGGFGYNGFGYCDAKLPRMLGAFGYGA
jgi:hypothetical protein